MDASLAAPLLAAAVKICAGTLLYLCILSLARIDAFAAGMMLTFPALNGLALLFAADPLASARTMMLMPVINTALVLLYVLAFRALGKGSGLLAVAGFLLWLLPAGLAAMADPVPVVAGHPVLFAVVVTVLGLGAPAAARLLRARTASAEGMLSSEGGAPATLPMFLWSHRMRIGLFVVSLVALVVATTFVPRQHALIGVLGGLPLVPLFGLWAVARGQQPEVRLAHMATTVSAGAAIALWFVILFASLCARLGLNERWVVGLLPIVVCWGATFLAILLVARLLRALHPSPRELH